MPFSLELLSAVLLVGSATAVYGVRMRRKQRADTRALAEAKERGLDIPQSLHPVIDPDICIGSFSCLKACPEGDILGIVGGRAHLISGANCIGHGKCALECPVGAIKLVFGTSERGVDLPEVSEHFESSRPGVYVVGELGGMGLIRNAITQGVQAARHIASLGPTPRQDGAVDALIVGAGPSGLAAALGLREAGLSFRIVDQETVGGTIAHYPRQKVVMTERIELPIFGKFGKRLISKEELLESWLKAIEKGRIEVEERVRVTGIEGRDGDFTVLTSKEPIRARKVILAIGRRGTPRKLGVPGEDLEKVAYRLIDPQQYEGTRVLVVGAGDSALEAVIQLAEETDAELAISCRGEAFTRCREANRQKVEALFASGRVRALMSTQMLEVEPTRVRLKGPDGEVNLENDFVLACIGGDLPQKFLDASGIGMRRYTGQSRGEAAPAEGRPRAKRGSAVADAEQRSNRRFAFVLFTLGALVVAALAVVGWEYYLLPKPERLRSPLHKLLKPSGPWGNGIGIGATLFMMSNFLYPLRKRLGFLKGTAPIRRWLVFHQFVGFMSPVLVGFHAAFQSNNAIASITALSLAVVVTTGVIGRFFYGLVPSREGRALELREVLRQFERLRGRFDALLRGVEARARLEPMLALAGAEPASGSLPGFFIRAPVERLQDHFSLRRVRGLFPSADHYAEFRSSYLRLRSLNRQVAFYGGLKRLLSVWRMLHVVQAVLLVLTMAAHIGISIYLGYGGFLS